MARPSKSGIDYFTLDVDLDDKFDLVEAKYGIEGFGLAIKLFQTIYRNGYFYHVDEERLLLFKKRVNVDINLIEEMIQDGLRWGLFDKKLYEKYNILTSRGIQKRYIEATKRRKEVEFIAEYLLITIDENTYPPKVNVNINRVNVDINSINPDIGTQSKVKESKVKESIKEIPAFDLQKYLERYSDHKLIHDTITALTTTRKTGKIADSILEAQFTKWERYPVDQVQAAMRIYLDKDCAGEGKAEKYLTGIIRHGGNGSGPRKAVVRGIDDFIGKKPTGTDPAKNQYLRDDGLKQKQIL